MEELLAPQHEELAGALDTLHVCLGHARLYGYEHARTMQAIGEALQELGAVLDRRGTVELATSPSGLFWDGVLVRPESDDRPGLGRLLHREGIAALSFEAGLPIEELAGLLGVLRINLSLPENEEETLDSLLWQMAFSHIGYRAVHSLAEAEALSGGLEESAGEGWSDAVDGMLDYKPGQTRADGRPRRLSEDAITRAVAGSGLDDLGPQADQVLKGLPDRDWARLFSEESEDRDAMAKMRADLERETSGDLASSLFYVLLQAGAEGRPELHTPKALHLASALLHELGQAGELQGLAKILAERQGFCADPRLLAAPSYQHVVGYLTDALDTNTLVRVLLRVEPGVEQAGLDRLLSALPDDGLSSLVQAAVDDPDEARRGLLFAAMGRSVQDRVERFVVDIEHASAERALSTVLLLRALNSARGKAGRRALLRHANPRVRAAAAAWYADDLPAEDAVPLLEMLLERDRDVRRAAAGALAAQKPARAMSFFRRAFDTHLAQLPPDHRKEICVSCATVCGERALELLGPLFEAEAKVKESTSLEAAAFGLAAVGSVRAVAILKKGAGGWNRARKAACRAALASMDS